MSLGPKYTISEDEMYSMKLQPGSSFVWEREFIDHGYIIVDHEETPLKEEDVLCNNPIFRYFNNFFSKIAILIVFLNIIIYMSVICSLLIKKNKNL